MSTQPGTEGAGFNLSRWAIQHPSIIRFLFGLILITGALGLFRMGQKEDPDFTFRTMIIQVAWPGASIEEMQDQVVNKIERKLQETPHLDYIRSFSRAGSAIITVNIKGDTKGLEVKDAFYQVRKKVGDISSAAFPAFSDPISTTSLAIPSSPCTRCRAKASAMRS